MIKFFVILLFLLNSCAYPDIDTVPDFKDVKVSDKETIELCKFKNPYISPKKVLVYTAPMPTYKYVSNNYKRLKCFEKLNKITNRLWINQEK